MKHSTRLIFAALVLIGLFVSSSSSPVSASTVPSNCGLTHGVILYEHPDYQGRCRALQYKIGYANLNSIINFDNMASSIRFIGAAKGNWQVNLYDGTNYQGEATVFRSDVPNFGVDTTIGHDRATSVVVRDTCLRGSGVVLYQHGNYLGGCLAFTTDGVVPNLSWHGFNDMASSVELVGGRIVWLYEHDYYRGTVSRVIRSDRDLGNDAIGHDRTTSLLIRYN